MTIPVLLSNNAGTVLALPLASGGTSATLYSGAGALFPNPGAGQYFPLTLISASNPATIEIVYCTARSGDVVTITRAQEGTTALSWNAGDLVNNQITAGIVEDIESRFALLAGSSSQVFNVAQALTSTEAVQLGQFVTGIAGVAGYIKIPNSTAPSQPWIIQVTSVICPTAQTVTPAYYAVAFPNQIIQAVGSSLSLNSYAGYVQTFSTLGYAAVFSSNNGGGVSVIAVGN
jgi:hypothetical protein